MPRPAAIGFILHDRARNWVRFARLTPAAVPPAHPDANWLRFARFALVAPAGPTCRPAPTAGRPRQNGFVLHSQPRKLGSFRTFSLSGTPARLPVWLNWVRFAHFALRRPQAGRSRCEPASNPRSAIEKLASFCTLDPSRARPFLSIQAQIGFVLHDCPARPHLPGRTGFVCTLVRNQGTVSCAEAQGSRVRNGFDLALLCASASPRE